MASLPQAGTFFGIGRTVGLPLVLSPGLLLRSALLPEELLRLGQDRLQEIAVFFAGVRQQYFPFCFHLSTKPSTKILLSCRL